MSLAAGARFGPTARYDAASLDFSNSYANARPRLEGAIPMDRQKYYEACANTLERYLTRRYRIPVLTFDVADPFTGDLDGREIHIDYKVEPAERLFLIAHLFGHTVQWSVSPSSRQIGRDLIIPVPEAMILSLLDFEREAASYGLKLMHNNKIKDLDQWFADYSACDLAYLANYYRTGEKKGAKDFWRPNQPPVVPKGIPRRFKPKKWVSRNDGVVI
jgi:hypothetical protein